ncbi:M35 family metallo-endopeptidase [Motiliproteus sp. MSK22-1]|uniref:M35 family metallo-endopeptidase n=1 Tax=Motiliproteus sp. MSK22-1 TaxID=1897630 RepID=UPI000978CD04|nr:M35 family metallo-endopeptidase [Motiliproteus sp. MSK22-1]OMH38320.1 hypothetical protein BGP75_08740 [Motiliproteus sp. MSK22-1]
MKKFTEAYKKARSVLQTEEYEKEWHKFLTITSGAKALIGDTGFEKTHAASSDSVREKIKKDSNGAFVSFFIGGDCGDVIYNAAENAKAKATHNDRAATLKFLRHVYHEQNRGGQQVWVYSPPKAYSSWVYDELKGTESQVKSKLRKNKEVFSAKERTHMCNALALARKIAEDTKVKLGKKDEATKKLVKRWFFDEDTGDDKMDATITKLTDGFKKIAQDCNSDKLVFTDYPDWRSSRKDYFGAAFRNGEGGGFPIIYLEGAFTRLTGNSGKLWLCALTIIHELSHFSVGTQDHRYDHAGLKPSKTTFKYAKTMENADSWGYFATDLAGYLSKADYQKTWK